MGPLFIRERADLEIASQFLLPPLRGEVLLDDRSKH
jgi:hypothetical protein